MMRSMPPAVVGAMVGLVAWATAVPLAVAADQAWEIRGDFQSLEPGNPERVVLKLQDGSRIELPLQAFSAAGRESIRAAVNRPAAAPVEPGSVLAKIEEAAARSRTAEEAVRVFRLALAGDDAPEDLKRQGAAALARWEERAARREVRLGDEWVAPEKAEAARRAGERHFGEVVALARLGNLKLVREALEKASRADPASGRADFILGLAAALGVGQRPDPAKARKSFAEVVAREPDNGAALANLAACDVFAGRFDSALENFKAAAACLEQPQVIAPNVASLIGGAGRPQAKLTAKQVEGFTGLYRRLAVDQPGQPAGLSVGLPAGSIFLSPFGQPVNPQAGLDEWCAPPTNASLERTGPGLVIAPDVLLVSDAVPFRGGTLTARTADGRSGEFFAEEIASSRGLGLLLVRCTGLPAKPIPLAAALPAAPAPLAAVLPAVAGTANAALPDPGAVVAVEAMPGVFVHTAAATGRVGVPLIDRSGRMIGLSMTTPRATLPGPTRSFGRSIDAIWPLLKDHLPDLRPVEDGNPAPSWEAVAGELSRGVVTVVSRPPAGGVP